MTVTALLDSEDNSQTTNFGKFFPKGYHLGITCEYKEDGKRFYHKVPTGPTVVVSAVTPTHEQMYRFLHLIINIGEMSEYVYQYLFV